MKRLAALALALLMALGVACASAETYTAGNFYTLDYPEELTLDNETYTADTTDDYIWLFMLYGDYVIDALESQEIPMDYSKVVLNSGIVMSDRKHAHIWKPPLHPFFPTHCSEQFWIQNNARGLPFFQLPTEFNTQYWMPNFRELLPTAKVVHLANCPPTRRLEFARQFTSSLATA